MKLKDLFTLSIIRVIMGTFAFSMIGALTSCSSDDPITEPVIEPETASQAITFTTNINASASTRATNTTWTANDFVGVFMLDTDDKLSEAHHKVNHQYKAESYTEDTETKWKLVPADETENLYYPVDGSEVHFTAYYPYVSTVSKTGISPDEVPGTYAVSLGDQSKPAEFDLLYHKGTAAYKKGDKAAGMIFDHELSKVIVNLKLSDDMKGDDDGAALLSSMAVAIKNIPTSADFDLAAGTLSKWGAGGTEDSKGNVAPNKVAAGVETPESTEGAGNAVLYAATYEAIIVPHTVANESEYPGRTIEFSFNDPDDIDVTLTYKIPDTNTDPVTAYKAFNPGKQTIYTFTLTREKVIVENVTINEWGNDGAPITEDLF